MTLKQVNLNKAYYLSYPMITPLITSGTNDHANVMTATWTTPISTKPPLYGVSIAPSRFSHDLIEETGEFGVCFLDFEAVEKVLKAGRMSGSTVDKFQELDLQKQSAASISAPLIASSISALECTVHELPRFGDHTLFVGEVVAAWAKEKALKQEVLNLEQVKPIFYLGANRFCTSQEWDKLVKD